MRQLTAHFTLDELTRSELASRQGLDNTPDALTVGNLTALCGNILEPLRLKLDKPIQILSGYRSHVVNLKIGGAKTSQHLIGQAADIIVSGMSVQELFDFIVSAGLPFDQVIQEFDTWVHVSYSLRNRRQKLRASRNAGQTVYTTIS